MKDVWGEGGRWKVNVDGKLVFQVIELIGFGLDVHFSSSLDLTFIKKNKVIWYYFLVFTFNEVYLLPLI